MGQREGALSFENEGAYQTKCCLLPNSLDRREPLPAPGCLRSEALVEEFVELPNGCICCTVKDRRALPTLFSPLTTAHLCTSPRPHPPQYHACSLLIIAPVPSALRCASFYPLAFPQLPPDARGPRCETRQVRFHPRGGHGRAARAQQRAPHSQRGIHRCVALWESTLPSKSL